MRTLIVVSLALALLDFDLIGAAESLNCQRQPRNNGVHLVHDRWYYFLSIEKDS
jgi:hypothetical protein